MVRDNRYVSTYIFGAICPERAVGAALIMPQANTEAMNRHLAEISREVAPGAHAILVCDGAGWHQRGKKLRLPHNITLLSLPPYSPELNPMENVWAYLRQNKLCARAMTTSSTPAKAHGGSSSTIQTASDQSAPEPGRVSISRGAGIIPVEGRTLASGVLLKRSRIGDWR
jgi:DDE superfamily endonuclease